MEEVPYTLSIRCYTATSSTVYSPALFLNVQGLKYRTIDDIIISRVDGLTHEAVDSKADGCDRRSDNFRLTCDKWNVTHGT